MAVMTRNRCRTDAPASGHGLSRPIQLFADSGTCPAWRSSPVSKADCSARCIYRGTLESSFSSRTPIRCPLAARSSEQTAFRCTSMVGASRIHRANWTRSVSLRARTSNDLVAHAGSVQTVPCGRTVRIGLRWLNLVTIPLGRPP